MSVIRQTFTKENICQIRLSNYLHYAQYLLYVSDHTEKNICYYMYLQMHVVY
jgi:hypothetical protein